MTDMEFLKSMIGDLGASIGRLEIAVANLCDSGRLQEGGDGTAPCEASQNGAAEERQSPNLNILPPSLARGERGVG